MSDVVVWNGRSYDNPIKLDRTPMVIYYGDDLDLSTLTATPAAAETTSSAKYVVPLRTIRVQFF